MFGNSFKPWLFAIVLFATIVFFLPKFSTAQTAKDSDLDGITDDAEINVYHTNPYRADTDGDGVMDYREILDGTNPNDPNSSVLAKDKQANAALISRQDPLAWYIGRASGIGAFVLFSIVVCFGLFMSSKSFLKFKFLSSPTALETHKTIALIAIMLVVVHFSSFFYDSFLRLSLRDALIPFTVQSNLKSILGYSLNLSIPFGIFAFYLGCVLVVTSYFRSKIVSLKTWRLIHYSTFVFYTLFLIHGFLGGTDTKEWWMKTLYIASLACFTFLLLLRIFAKKLFYPKPPAVKPIVPAKTEVPQQTTPVQTIA